MALCKCREPSAERAIWRNLNQESTFTGIVKVPVDGSSVLKKLDNPDAGLDGPGHEMTNVEFLSQMAMYDGSEERRVQQPIECEDYTSRNLCVDDVVFWDAHFEEERPYDVHWFPFDEHGKPLVRADDEVAVKAIGHSTRGQLASMERFWAHVVSVTPCGIVTAVPMATLYWQDVTPDMPIYFPVTAVMGSRHGAYWM